MPDPFDITGRVAIITGGSRGLGRAMAEEFAARGAMVVIANRDAESCEKTVAAIEASGGIALGVPTDLASMEGLQALVDATVARFGGIDILLNNAADSSLASSDTVDEATWDRVMTVNSKSPFFLAQAALPYLEASGRGSIVNLLSVGAWIGGAHMILYRTSKSALLGTTMVLAKEWASRGVRVNAIAPGTFETDMIGWMDDDARARSIAVTPQARIADPTELVPAVLYLASDAASFTTGMVLRVDGGMLSW